MPLTRDFPSLATHEPSVSGFVDLQKSFRSPPASYGPVPFYWWAGEKLDRGRIAWQLDRLCEKGVRRTIVSYPHHPDGTSNLGDPVLFSPEWWDLFRWFLTACRERGMTAGFQDYTLVEPILKAIGRETPGMQGGQMSCTAQRVSGKSRIHLSAEPGALVIGAWAYPEKDGLPCMDARIDLSEWVDHGALDWSVPAGDWLVALVFARINAFDPLHPDSGTLAIGRLYAPFERECPDEFGKTLNLFFQDELDFGCRMPFWSNHLFEAFSRLKGYDLYPLLPALWHDMGPITEKIRLDFADVVTRRVEECYFKPVFRWHEERGTLFGHDNCGRGRIAQGRRFYGDYFRAMRWYTAPGCDDPKLQGARAFKGLKVNSSIAHLYQRPRVWVEAFHSSGWGTSPADVVAALNEDFAYGATVVNLHGLYYTTRGGWWEWAPPDFHFRQPYWQHAWKLNDYFTRVSWLLSQGNHRCDVAIVYPIAALDAEPADPSHSGVITHIGNENVDPGEDDYLQAEKAAFSLGKHLFDHACDFDFIDFESLAAADVRDHELRAGSACYRVLVFPAMKAVRYSMIMKALEFVRAGGLVIAFGCLPVASDRSGREDPQLDALLEEIFGSTGDAVCHLRRHPGGGKAFFFRSSHAAVLDAIGASIERDFISSVPLQVLHRALGDRDVYFIFNPADESVTADLRFRRMGRVERWDAWTGHAEALPSANPQRISLAARESAILVFPSDSRANGVAPVISSGGRIETLEGPWTATILPTLDNRFGDFSLPATPELLGPQARRFRYSDEYSDEAGWISADFDDSAWPETTFSFGPRMEFAGPLPPDHDFNEALLEWSPYAFSRRWGIERDPFLTSWLSGPHGLKGEVPDEFLDFHSDTPGSVWYVRAKVVAPAAGGHTLVTGARCIYQVWLNGDSVAGQSGELQPGFYVPWSIPHYECQPLETRVSLKQGVNDLLIKLVQPAGQRTRAYVAFDPAPAAAEMPALRWFTDPSAPCPCLLAPAERRAIRFRFHSPPGATEMTFTTRGPASAWANGKPVKPVLLEILSDGYHRYRATITSPSAESALMALRVEAPVDSHGGDALPEPVRFVCGPGRITPGDWSQHGLATYSGAVAYSTRFETSDAKSQIQLDLGEVRATAEVRINGMPAATLIAPPWKCDLTPFLHPGGNELSIIVANTLANYYSVGYPSPYAFDHQTPSGLMGPVRLITHP